MLQFLFIFQAKMNILLFYIRKEGRKEKLKFNYKVIII